MVRRYLIMIMFSLAFCNYTESQQLRYSDQVDEAYESEYYYALTEATRLTIYQNYPQAVNLYMKCLEYNPNSSAIRYQLSVIHYRLGRINEAKEFGRQAYARDPGNRWYLINLIHIYQTTNRADSAIEFTRALMKLEPGNIGNYYDLGVLYQINKEYKKALELYNFIENNFGRSNEIYINKYKIYRNSGKEKTALEQLDLALALTPDDLNIVGLKAEHYRDMGERKLAEEYYSLLLRNDQQDPVAVFSYLDFLLKYRQFEKALDYFILSLNSKAIENEHVLGYFMNESERGQVGDDYKSFMDTALGYFYEQNRNDLRINGLYIDYIIKQGNYAEASTKLKEIIIGNERNYRIWEQILFTENALNHADSVMKYGDKIIELFEYESLPYLYTGIAYQQHKDNDKAIRLLEKGLRLTENKNMLVQFYIFLAGAYQEGNQLNKSFDLYEKALSIDRNNKLIMNNYAYFLALEEKELEKAEMMSRYTLTDEKQNYIYLDTYAWILYKLNKVGKAWKYIRKAVKYGGGKSSEVMEHYNEISEKNRGK